MEMGHYLEVNYTDLKYPIIFFYHFFSKGRDIRNHFHQEIEIIYVQNGKLRVSVEGENYDYQTVDIILIPSNAVHAIQFENVDNHIFTYLLSLEVFKQYQIDIEALCFKLDKENIDKAVFQTFETYQDMSSLKKHIVMYQVYEKILKYSHKSNPHSQTHTIIDDVISYIQKHYNQDLSLEILAEQFHFHPNYLSRRFKKRTSMSLHRYLLRVRMNHAYQDIVYTKDNIVDIVYRHGFKQLRSFNRLFKEMYGCTPSKYRKALDK